MATLKEDAIIIAGIGLGVVVLAWYAKNQAGKAITAVSDAVGDAVGNAVTVVGDAVSTVTPYVNPASDQNVAYTSVNSFLHLLGMDKGDTLGTAVYGYVHKTDIAPDGTMPNYTKAQQDADYKAMLQLQNGYHGL